jgi:arabinose-5-phosphate isomerase
MQAPSKWVIGTNIEDIRLADAAKITSLFVVDAGKPVGIVHVHDLLRVGVV